MHDADLERRLEGLAPPGPRPDLEAEVLGAVEVALARPTPRARVLLFAAVAALLMAGVFLVAREAGLRSGAPPESIATEPEPPPPPPPPLQKDCPPDLEHPPLLVLDLPEGGLDFGDVRQDVVLERDVVFHNEGTGPLCIRRVDSGCGCIKVQLVGEARRFEVGGAGRVRVTLDTRGRDGNLKKTTTIHTNDPKAPLVRFVVRARVALGLRLTPSHLRFGRVSRGRPAEAIVRVRAPLSDGEWAVTSVRGTRPVDGELVVYGWSVDAVSDPRDRVYDLRITHPGTERTGPVTLDTLVVGTTHPERREVEVRSSLTVTELVLATPRRAVLGFVPNDAPARVQLRPGSKDAAFRIEGVSFERDDGTPLADGVSGFVAAFGRQQEGAAEGTWWVDVRYDARADRPPGPLRAVLVLRTDSEALPEVRIECFATVRK